MTRSLFYTRMFVAGFAAAFFAILVAKNIYSMIAEERISGCAVYETQCKIEKNTDQWGRER